jgi:hypothetical protein
MPAASSIPRATRSRVVCTASGVSVRQCALGAAGAGNLAGRLHLAAGVRLRRSQSAAGKAGKAGRKTGTRVTFKPDVTIMEATEFNYDTLAQRLRELAFLNKGLKITLTDERVDPEKKTEFLYTGGIAEFIKHLNAARPCCTTSRFTSRRTGRCPTTGRSPWKWRCSTTTGTRRTSSASPTTSTPWMAERT